MYIILLQFDKVDNVLKLDGVNPTRPDYIRHYSVESNPNPNLASQDPHKYCRQHRNFLYDLENYQRPI